MIRPSLTAKKAVALVSVIYAFLTFLVRNDTMSVV